MEPRDRVELRECCVVAYRVSGLGVEFCLITPAAENRWEFPKTSLGGQDAPSPALLEQAATQAGVRGQIQTQTPLGNFAATRGNEAREMTGFLMRVAQVDETWPRQTTHKRLWCLAEEARLALRGRRDLGGAAGIAFDQRPQRPADQRQQPRHGRPAKLTAEHLRTACGPPLGFTCRRAVDWKPPDRPLQCAGCCN